MEESGQRRTLTYNDAELREIIVIIYKTLTARLTEHSLIWFSKAITGNPRRVWNRGKNQGCISVVSLLTAFDYLHEWSHSSPTIRR